MKDGTVSERDVGEDRVHDDRKLQSWHLGSHDIGEVNVYKKPNGADRSLAGVILSCGTGWCSVFASLDSTPNSQ